jgi:hypothetical protein
MVAKWSEEVEREGPSRITWEIEPVGTSCRLLRFAESARA